MYGATDLSAFVFVNLLLCQCARALNCTTCTWNDQSTDMDCFSGTAPLAECPYASTIPVYCRTTMTLNDGYLVSIDRGCQVPSNDYDKSTDFMPTAPECTTSYSIRFSSNVETTLCYYACNNTDGCNTEKSDKLKFCTVDCGLYGNCDYISGSCVCQTGYTGETCTTGSAPGNAPDTFMSCIQCSEDVIGPSCTSMTTSTSCPEPDDKFCSSTVTTTYSADGTELRSILTKGCTTTFVASDECYFSTRSDQANTDDLEYTCISTCDGNGCNTGIPTGLTNVKQPIQCVVCDSSEYGVGSGCATMTTRSYCPSTATYCSATVVYYLSDKSDARYQVDPEASIQSVVRVCASSPVTAGCTTESVTGQESFKKVTCQETCQTDGCNTGWPGRPKCSVCADNVHSPDGYSLCLNDPPTGEDCTQPYHQFCYIKDNNRNRFSTTGTTFGYRRSIERGCTYKSIGNTCADVNYGDVTLMNCNKSCTTENCNLGSATDTASMIYPRWTTFLLAMLSVFIIMSYIL